MELLPGPLHLSSDSLAYASALTAQDLCGRCGVPGQLSLSKELLTGLAHCPRCAQALVGGWRLRHSEPAGRTNHAHWLRRTDLPPRTPAQGRQAAPSQDVSSRRPPSPLQSHTCPCPYPAICGFPKGASGDTSWLTLPAD